MSAYKADEYVSNREFHDNHQTIFVASDIEDIMLVAHVIRSREVHFDVRKVSPFSFFRYIVPAS